MIIKPEPLTQASFLPFGDVLEAQADHSELINCGNTQKFADLASIVTGEEGKVQLSIYRSKPIELPFRIKILERHPLGSQAFYPLHGRPFPVVVALPGESPGPAEIRAFISNGRQGININAGVWHHYQLSLGQESDYLVIDRYGNGGNFEECRISGDVLLNVPP